eukprot:snap_masked-scaffold_102-processed-gene-0.23-mRNA-1 protein AED:1.00 eAED:1.00 QI:0/0/0/0/1/1/2/0/75
MTAKETAVPDRERYDPLEEGTPTRRQGEMEPSIKEKKKMKDGLLYFKWMLVIPRALITQILITNHISKGHPSKAD